MSDLLAVAIVVVAVIVLVVIDVRQNEIREWLRWRVRPALERARRWEEDLWRPRRTKPTAEMPERLSSFVRRGAVAGRDDELADRIEALEDDRDAWKRRYERLLAETDIVG